MGIFHELWTGLGKLYVSLAGLEINKLLKRQMKQQALLASHNIYLWLITM